MKINLPEKPPQKLLNSMALRYDHSLGCTGYYDQEFFKNSGLTHKQRYDAAITIMKQLYEEVSGYGFFNWDKYETEKID